MGTAARGGHQAGSREPGHGHGQEGVQGSGHEAEGADRQTDGWMDGRMDEWMDEACSGSTGTRGSRGHSSNTGTGHSACAVSSAWAPLTAGGAGALGGLP